jgi:hypothetical protein
MAARNVARYAQLVWVELRPQRRGRTRSRTTVAAGWGLSRLPRGCGVTHAVGDIPRSTALPVFEPHRRTWLQQIRGGESPSATLSSDSLHGTPGRAPLLRRGRTRSRTTGAAGWGLSRLRVRRVALLAAARTARRCCLHTKPAPDTSPRWHDVMHCKQIHAKASSREHSTPLLHPAAIQQV